MGQRYELMEEFVGYGSGKPQFAGYSVEMDGKEIKLPEACGLLNAQAETIEVLREWLRKCGQKLIADEREIIEHSEFSSPEDVIESKRRIAALEGK